MVWNATTHVWDITPAVTYAADGEYGYTLSRVSNSFFDDDVTVAVDPSTGLLQTVKASSTDQTISSVSNLVGVVGSVMTLAGTLQPIAAGRGEAAELTEIKSKAVLSVAVTDVSVDQPSADPVFLMSPAAPDGGYSYAEVIVKLQRVQNTTVAPNVAADTAVASTTAEGTNPSPPEGINVRLPAVCRLIIEERLYDGASAKLTDYQVPPKILLLPDPKADYVLPIHRRPFVADVTNITISNGMPVSMEQVRPSMVAAVIGIPKSILAALVPIPLQIRQSQQNIYDAEAKILSDKAAIKAAQP